MKVDLDKVSYVLGQSVGGDFKRQGFEIDPKIFVDSFIAAFNGKQSDMPVGEMQHIMQNFRRAMEDKKQAERMESQKKILKPEKNFLKKIVKKRGLKLLKADFNIK